MQLYLALKKYTTLIIKVNFFNIGCNSLLDLNLFNNKIKSYSYNIIITV